MTQRPSTLPNNTSIRLPPLSPPLQSHPQAFNNSSLPVVYSLKLPQDVVNTLLSAPSSTTVCFNKLDSGQIVIPNAKPIPFSVHPIADANAATGTARAACYTRRQNSLRTVGPIIADLEVERTLSSANSTSTKKRTLDLRNSSNTRELKVVDDIPTTQLAKKPRKKPIGKRPRAPHRPTPPILSAPIPPSTATNGLRIPRPTNTSPPFRSPAVSPGHHPNPKPNGSTRTTPTRNSFSAMQSHRVSPASLVNLPNPVSRRTPTKSNRYSPGGSRGPSPGISSPGSPRVSGVRPPKIGDHAEVRRHVLHFLAMGQSDFKAVKDKLESARVDFSPRTLQAILTELADMKGGKYVLREKSWAEVTDRFEYTSAERAKMKVYRTEVESGSDKLKRQNMSDEQLDAAVDNFWRDYKDVEERVTCEKEESELRKRFMVLYPLYTEVIIRMEDVQKLFKTLETRFLTAKSKDEKEGIARRITNNHKKLKGRHWKLERVLPMLHTRMKRIRRALDDYTNSDEER